MNLILAITVTVVQHAALCSCRSVSAALFTEGSAESSPVVESHSLYKKEHLADVRIPHLEHSQETKYYPYTKRDHEKRAKITFPQDEERGKSRRIFNTNRKQFIELLPVRHKGRGKTVAYILAPDGDKGDFRGLINGQFEIENKEASHSDEGVSDISKESGSHLNNDFDEPVIQHESHANYKHSNENVRTGVNYVSKESKSYDETSDVSYSGNVRNYVNSKEYDEKSNELEAEGDLVDKSELRDLHDMKINHQKQSQEDNSDEYDVGSVNDTENVSNEHSEESSSSYTFHSDSNEHGDSTGDNEGNTPQDNFEVKRDISQENISQLKEYSVNAFKNVETLRANSKENTSRNDSIFEEYVDDKIDTENVGDLYSEDISKMQFNDLIEIIELHEEDIGKRKHDCKHTDDHEGRDRLRKKGERHSYHNTYRLSFLFSR